MTAAQTLRDLLAADSIAKLQTDDVLHLLLPLMRDVSNLHAHGRVAELGSGDIVRTPDGTLQMRRAEGMMPTPHNDAIKRIQPPPASTLNIIGESCVTVNELGAVRGESLDVHRETDALPSKPIFLVDLGSWELALGHHDEITDVFQLGQILACLACGLDFHDIDDLELFVAHRRDLFRLNQRLHPVVANVIVEMTQLNRHDRAKDLSELVRRLETWRDQPVSLDVERVLADQRGTISRRAALMSHLRDRLFDLSRRNRLLHFRPTQASTNLTVASVPLVLQVQSIRPEQLATWNSQFSSEVLSGDAVPLQRWLRFDDQPYLSGTLDKIIQETRRDRAEYGFSNLRLVISFLRWHDLKENPDQRILSPFIWLPVELQKRKGVRDQFVLQCTDTEAEVNPALRHWLRQLYNIELPETIDLSKVSMDAIHADLQAQIRRSEPGVELRHQKKPSIQLIHQKAVQRIEQFNRKRGIRLRKQMGGSLPSFSYAVDDFRPLGLAWFRRDVEHAPLPLRSAAGAAMPSRNPSMASSNTTESATYALQDDPGHRYAWDMDLTQVTLANLNYKKMSLVSDYNQLIDESLETLAFDKVFSIEPRAVDSQAPPPLSLKEQWSVVASDRTQNAAVTLARSGRNFIIQGPPGTGKSQTITNLIADYAARNKRVLFVCEKRAALDVVFYRLKQSGLDDLCCLIHDSQTDKKAFIGNLREGYERWIAKPDQRDTQAAIRDRTVATLDADLSQIDGYESAMASVPAPAAESVRNLLRRLIELGPAELELSAVEREQLPDHRVFAQHRDLTERVHAFVRARFGLQSLAQHPFRFLSGWLVSHTSPVQAVEAALDQAESLLDGLDSALSDETRLLSLETSLSDAVVLAQTLRLLVDTQLAPHPQLLDEHSPAAIEFEQAQTNLTTLSETASATRSANVQWREKLSPVETESALLFVRQRESSFIRWFLPAWWRLRGMLHRAYDFTPHAVKPTFRKILELLTAEHVAAAAHAQAATAIQQRYGVTEVSTFVSGLQSLRERLTSYPILRALRQKLTASQSPDQDVRREVTSEAAIKQLSTLIAERFRFAPSTTLAQLAEHVRDLRESVEDLPDALPLLQDLHQADPKNLSMLLSIPEAPTHLESVVAWETLSRIHRLYPTLARFDESALSRIAGRAAQSQRSLLTQNAALIQSTRHKAFLQHVRQSSLSATQLDADGKLFKKQYAQGRRELEHEFGKSMRFRSIREMAGGDSGRVIDDLKPIWLMSPLSVSDTLPLRTDLFDVVIFDEASQIPMEEAVPALCRAPQVVIVGDEMQLPPTSFFSAANDADDDLIEGSGDENGIGITLDADSLLNQAARNLPATMLAWHYRSRYEALISFSNAAFYEGGLITIPDRSIEKAGECALTLRSDEAASASRGADALLERAVSFHRLSDGVYLERSNAPEAKYIAQLVRELFTRETKMSVGIVAFSEAQQTEIENALEALADEDSVFAAKLEAELVREDDDQFNGLFVKNLENVQGDERDVILLSICYGPGPDGRMMMNFGPINQRGGEKRLNVIFSRARHRMAVISTIRAEAITNTHNDGAAALRAFLQFAEACSNGDSPRAQSVLAALNPGAQQAFNQVPPRDALRQTLMRALKARGHEVDEYVGRSSFRCDLAIRDPLGDGYVLGLLLDGGHPSGRHDSQERYVFRPGILRAFGWRVLEVLSGDWLRDSAKVLERIEAALAASPETEVLEAPNGESLVQLERQKLEAPTFAAPDLSTTFPTREFRMQEGATNKFWRVGVSHCDVIVSYGRVGTKGQTLTKTFDSPERAKREMAKLLAEKQRKGYLESLP